MNNSNLSEYLLRMGLPKKEAHDLLSISELKAIKKDKLYISAGDIPKKFAIVLTGLFRYYYLSDHGSEFTKGFIVPGHVLSSYSAMLHQTPSLFFIQALDPSEILNVDYKSWLELQKDNSFWDKFLIRALEKGYCVKEKRERELLLLDAETRYQNFIKEFPDLESKVALQIVASYLGIRAESLSRIRKKLSS